MKENRLTFFRVPWVIGERESISLESELRKKLSLLYLGLNLSPHPSFHYLATSIIEDFIILAAMRSARFRPVPREGCTWSMRETVTEDTTSRADWLSGFTRLWGKWVSVGFLEYALTVEIEELENSIRLRIEEVTVYRSQSIESNDTMQITNLSFNKAPQFFSMLNWVDGY